MARGDIADELEMQSEEVTAQVQGQGPIQDVRRRIKNNVHEANRQAKSVLPRAVKDKLRTGVEGEGYNKDYAKEKRQETRRSYGIGGPVDFRYEGRLWRELVGRGRARPSEPSLQIWLALKHPNRKHPHPRDRSGGSDISYRGLANVLAGMKPGDDGNPFSPSRKGRERIAQKVALSLLGED